MTDWEPIEKLRELILELGLPHNDFALFGVKCPYCGKSDRIYKLEPPEELKDVPEDYGLIWDRLSSEGELVVCKFCQQALSLSESGDAAAPLAEV